jgi:hypothetical protein
VEMEKIRHLACREHRAQLMYSHRRHFNSFRAVRLVVPGADRLA